MAATKPEANPEDIFGKYLFAPERAKAGEALPKPVEKNTKGEEEVKAQLGAHYHGEMDNLNPVVVRKLLELKSRGKYLNVLGVPKKYKHAYRILTFESTNMFEKFIGQREAPMHGVATMNLPPYHRFHLSWTVNPSMFLGKDAEDDLALKYRSMYFVLLKAPVDTNQFLLNPDVLPKLKDIVGDYGYQKEVISVGTVQGIKVAWMYCASNMNPADVIESLIATVDKG